MNSQEVKNKLGKPDFVYGRYWHYGSDLVTNFVSFNGKKVTEVYGDSLYEDGQVLTRKGDSRTSFRAATSNYTFRSVSNNEVLFDGPQFIISVSIINDTVRSVDLKLTKGFIEN